MFKNSKLSFKLSSSIIILILFVETALLVISYEKKCEKLIGMQKYEKALYGKNLIYTQTYIDHDLNAYAKNIIFLSLPLSALVSIGFILIYHQFVGKYLAKISRLNNEKSPLKTKEAFRKIPKDEIGELILSRVKMLARLEKEMGAKKKLLRILSHDLSNLLMISVGNISILKKMLNKEDSKIQKYLNKIEFAGKRQKELIDSVREIDANNDRLDSSSIKLYDLYEMVSESILIFEERLIGKNIEIKWESNKSDKLSVYVDRVLFINNIFNNLLSNAIKFSSRNSQIFFNAYTNDNEEVILQISDRGVGIPKEMLDNLFEGGVSISREGVDGEKGTGFGMGLVKDTLEKFSCKIYVESKEKIANSKDHGTKITIKFNKNTQNKVA